MSMLSENAEDKSRKASQTLAFRGLMAKKRKNLMMCVWCNLIMIDAPGKIREHLTGFWSSFRNPRPQRARIISGLIFKNLTAAMGFAIDMFKTNMLFCVYFPGVNKI
jgi:hypothetical protein